ncbi:MAG: heavy metal translocating P-type ATPase [bacterium]
MAESTLKTAEMQVEGFHCADCAVTIEKTVSKLGGVKIVQANFTSGKVKVSYDPAQVANLDLVQSVERIGYKVKQGAHRDIEKKKLWKDREFQLTLLSGFALTISLFIAFFTSNPKLFTAVGRTITVSVIGYLAAIFFGAFYFSREGWAALKSFRFNMSLLMSLAIVGAILIGEYVEAASLAFLYSGAELLESYAVERARNSLLELMKLTPDEARVKKNETEQTVPVNEVRVGDIVVIRPGEKVSVDGEIVEGASSVDQSPITGESIPVTKKTGEKVYAGSINVEGYLEVRVSESSQNFMLAKIIHMIEEAEAQKAPSQRFVEKFAKIYTPVVVATAFAVAIIPPLLFEASFHAWFIKALTLLVIACPCALVISTPVCVVSALTNASRNGILIKGGVYLEEMGKIKAIALDKTGTLTEGRLHVTDVIPLQGLSRNAVLTLAATLENRSEHPIAKAVVEAAGDVRLADIRDSATIPGLGVCGNVQGVKHFIGRPELFKNVSVELPTGQLQELQSQGKTTMLLGSETEILGILALQDKIRSNAIKTVFQLKNSGMEVVMITGDNHATAQAIAEQLGIEHFHSELLPEQKLHEITYLKEKYGKVAMVGDGINDAPALAAASVGIAMGVAGTDAALETADVALMADDLEKLPYLVNLSKNARGVISQNIWAAILIKFSLALGVFPGLVSLVVAVLIGDMGASLGVTSNALRLARMK